MITFPNAKINIGLRITGNRMDGYHDIETIFYPVSLSDGLEFVVSDQKAQKDSLIVTGLNTGTDPDDNLVIKTINKLRERNAFPFLKVHLHKVIPVGSGLGGGSSDAACLLKSLNRCFSLGVANNVLKSLALELGSDCPFFIDNIPSYASGRGEVLTPVRPVLNGYYLVIINPGVGINTREAFQNCSAGLPSVSLVQLIEYKVIEWEKKILNDFEEFAFKKHPVIGKIKEGLYRSDALFSLLSGSGSSVYGIFSEKPMLPKSLKDNVIWEGML